jgi:hypothetical protein
MWSVSAAVSVPNRAADVTFHPAPAAVYEIEGICGFVGKPLVNIRIGTLGCERAGSSCAAFPQQGKAGVRRQARYGLEALGTIG